MIVLKRLSNPKTRVEIDPQRLEKLFASGLSLAKVASELKLTYSYLSRRINASAKLNLACKNGYRRAQAEKGVTI